MTPLGVIISNNCFRHLTCAKSVKYDKIKPNWRIQKNVKKPVVFRRTWGLKRTHGEILRGYPLEAGFEGAEPLATFWNLCGFSVPGNDILVLRWGLNSVVYSPGHHQVFVSVSRPEWTSKFAPKSQGRSTLVASVPKWEWPTQQLWHAQKRWFIS